MDGTNPAGGPASRTVSDGIESTFDHNADADGAIATIPTGEHRSVRRHVSTRAAHEVPTSTPVGNEKPESLASDTGHRWAWMAAAAATTAAFAVGVAFLASAANTDRERPNPSPRKLEIELVSQPLAGVSGGMKSSFSQFWEQSIATRPHSNVLVLPVPQSPPRDPYEEPNLPDLGRISIPKIGLSEVLHQGVSLTSIDRGPAFWPGTALPGELGNMVIAGHRVTHTKPFRDIDQLVPGDRIYVSGPDSFAHVYEVTSSEIVEPKDMHIVTQSIAYEATLFACHPPGSADFRYVVHLRLIDLNGTPASVPPYEIVHT